MVRTDAATTETLRKKTDREAHAAAVTSAKSFLAGLALTEEERALVMDLASEHWHQIACEVETVEESVAVCATLSHFATVLGRLLGR